MSAAGMAAALGYSRKSSLEMLFSRIFIPPEPYPARYARHLPHAGKAFETGQIVFSRTPSS